MYCRDSGKEQKNVSLILLNGPFKKKKWPNSIPYLLSLEIKPRGSQLTGALSIIKTGFRVTGYSNDREAMKI